MSSKKSFFFKAKSRTYVMMESNNFLSIAKLRERENYTLKIAIQNLLSGRLGESSVLKPTQERLQKQKQRLF